MRQFLQKFWIHSLKVHTTNRLIMLTIKVKSELDILASERKTTFTFLCLTRVLKNATRATIPYRTSRSLKMWKKSESFFGLAMFFSMNVWDSLQTKNHLSCKQNQTLPPSLEHSQLAQNRSSRKGQQLSSPLSSADCSFRAIDCGVSSLGIKVNNLWLDRFLPKINRLKGYISFWMKLCRTNKIQMNFLVKT